MEYVKAGDLFVPAAFEYREHDADWDMRRSRSITFNGTAAQAALAFPEGAVWSIVTAEQTENGEATEELTCGEFTVAGDIIDHRDGTVTVKMGAETELEKVLALLLGGEDA